MEINYRPSLLKCFYWQNVDVGQDRKVQRMTFGKRKHINRIIDFELSFKLVEVNLMGSMFCCNREERNYKYKYQHTTSQHLVQTTPDILKKFRRLEGPHWLLSKNLCINWQKHKHMCLMICGKWSVCVQSSCLRQPFGRDLFQ